MTRAVAAAAAAVLSLAAAAVSPVTAASPSLGAAATIFGKSGGATSDCPTALTIPPTVQTIPRADGTLSVPVSWLSINGVPCEGGGVLVGAAHSAFAGEANATLPLGVVNAAYQGSGVALFDRYLRLASGGDFFVFYFPRSAATRCGGWEVRPGTALTFLRPPVDFLWGMLGSVQAGAAQFLYSPQRPLNCFLAEKGKTRPAPSLGEGVPVPIDVLSNVVTSTPGPAANSTAAATAPPTASPTATATPTPTPTPTPTASPTPTAEADSDSACFPAAAKVQLADGAHVPLAALPVGASVRVAAGVHDGAHSTVIGWSHKVRDVQSEFVAVTHTAGKLLLSPGHYVYVGGVAVTARSVRPGDVLTLGSGGVASVTGVGREVAAGLFNAHTAHGDVVVDGVVVSTYTDAVHPVVAHALLAPVRLAVRLGVVDPLGSFLHGARPWLAALAPRGK